MNHEEKAKQAQQLFDKVNVKVKELVPEYGNIYSQCHDKIVAVETCLTLAHNNVDKLTAPPCQDQIKHLKLCSDKASCPQQFFELANCLRSNPNDLSKCSVEKTNINNCLDSVGRRTMQHTKEELIKVMTPQQRKDLKEFFTMLD